MAKALSFWQTGWNLTEAIIKGYQIITVHFLAYSAGKKDLPVTKQKDTTRSHPEHGRKDLQRRKYLEGHFLGR